MIQVEHLIGLDIPALDPPKEKKEENGFDLIFLRRAWLLFTSCLFGDFHIWIGFLLVAVCAGLYSWISMQVGNYAGEFFSVVTKDVTSREDIGIVILTISGLYVSLAVVYAANKALTAVIGAFIRKQITKHFNDLYYTHNNFYKVSLCKDFKNPDQQMTQDIDRYSSSYSAIASQMVSSPIFIVFFGIRTCQTVHWAAPLILMGYYLVSFLIQRLLMSPVSGSTYKQEKLEGYYRFSAQKVATQADAVAVCGGAPTERLISEECFEDLYTNTILIVKWEWFIWWFSYSVSYLATVVGYLIIGLPLLLSDQSKGLSSDFVATGLYDLGMLAWGFTQITVLSSQLAEFAGYTNRIGKLYEYLIEVDSQNVPSSSNLSSYHLHNVTITNPTGKVLLKNVTLNFDKNTLIMGPSGCGKSTLIRALAALNFKADQNTMARNVKDVLFIPQVPHLPVGDIFQQVAYPRHKKDCPDLTPKKLKAILKEVGLDVLFEKPDLFTEKCWAFLSPGQTQKITMARVLYHHPKLAIIDEITSQVDLQSERQFYALCEKEQILVFSVGHRASLVQYHQVIYCVKDKQLVQVDGLTDAP